MIEAIFFWILALASIGGSLLIIFHRNPMTCALSLAGVSLVLAALFVTLQAFFLAAAQVIVYTGAVIVLFLFILMLTDIKNAEEEKSALLRLAISGITCLLLISAFVYAFVQFAPGEHVLAWHSVHPKNESLGQALFGGYALPFLITAILLLTATIGVITLTKNDAESN